MRKEKNYSTIPEFEISSFEIFGIITFCLVLLATLNFALTIVIFVILLVIYVFIELLIKNYFIFKYEKI